LYGQAIHCDLKQYSDIKSLNNYVLAKEVICCSKI